jgi:hypothetical protein
VLLTAATMGVAAGSEDAERSRHSWLDAHTVLLDGSRLRGRLPRDRDDCLWLHLQHRRVRARNLLLLRSSGDSKPRSCPDPISPDEAVRTIGMLGS